MQICATCSLPSTLQTSFTSVTEGTTATILAELRVQSCSIIDPCCSHSKETPRTMISTSLRRVSQHREASWFAFNGHLTHAKGHSLHGCGCHLSEQACGQLHVMTQMPAQDHYHCNMFVIDYASTSPTVTAFALCLCLSAVTRFWINLHSISRWICACILQHGCSLRSSALAGDVCRYCNSMVTHAHPAAWSS